ncbi:hypothetical protein LCGC14_1640810, partial [marine sediment metagenome]
MYNPFGRALTKSRKTSRRKVASAQSRLLKAMLSPATPSKKKPAKSAG